MPKTVVDKLYTTIDVRTRRPLRERAPNIAIAAAVIVMLESLGIPSLVGAALGLDPGWWGHVSGALETLLAFGIYVALERRRDDLVLPSDPNSD